jgi:hypothetical protein
MAETENVRYVRELQERAGAPGLLDVRPIVALLAGVVAAQQEQIENLSAALADRKREAK